MPWVGGHVARSAALWSGCSAEGLPDLARYSKDEQRRREKIYDAAVRDVDCELRTAQRSGRRGAGVEDRLITVFGRFATLALGLEADAVDLITHRLLPVGTELGRWTRRFDPSLGNAEIVQACRNAWTACGLQPLLGQPIRLTPAILAYSLMYPYTDNYLDDRDIPPEAKSRFSARFRQRLRGETAAPANQREAALWVLVSLVEGEYPRGRFPEVHESLLAIHAAQERSVAQLKRGSGLDDAEILAISCAKGGSSVVADAYLARGVLNEAESRFAFDWGVLLQLGDDLQDLRDDLRRGSATLFTCAVRRGERLDGLVRQLLAFCDRVATGMDALPDATPMLRRLLTMSWRSLVVGAAGNLREYFSVAFLEELETLSPFRLKFLCKRNRKLARRQGLYPSLFETLLEMPEREEGLLPECRRASLETTA